MAKHYVVCENMCLQEAYSKDEIDKNLSNFYTKNQIDKKINDTLIVQHTFSKACNWGGKVILPQTEPMDEYYVASVMCAHPSKNGLLWSNGMVWSNRLSMGDGVYLDQLNVILSSSPNQVDINFLFNESIEEEYLSFTVRVVLKRYNTVNA